MFVIVMKNIEELSEISLKLSSPQIKSSLSVGQYRVDTLKTMEWPAAMISHDEEQGEATCNSTKILPRYIVPWRKAAADST